MKDVLVTGLTGYVGTEVGRVLRERGYNPISSIGRYSDVDTVIHLAAVSTIPECNADPLWCYEKNVGDTIDLLKDIRLRKIIFFSTYSVFDSHPYGRSKRMCEEIIQDSGIKYNILRFYNIAGGGIWRKNETRLIPLMVRAAIKGIPFNVYGDGNQVRDYVHIKDAAEVCVNCLDDSESYIRPIGSGAGYSVNDVILMVEKITGYKLLINKLPERDGDYRKIVCPVPYPLKHSSLENIVKSTVDYYMENVCSHQI